MTPPDQSPAPPTPLPIFTPAPPSPFAGRLQEGERLLWEGRPDPRLFIWLKVVGVLLLGVPVLPLVILLESARTGTPLVWLSAKTLVVGTITVVFMAVYLYQQSRGQAQAAAYALSDRRVFIRRLERLTSQDWRPRVDEFSLQAVQPKLRTLGGGRGTITLGAPLWQYKKVMRGISDAAQIFALLTEARAALAGPSVGDMAEGPYYARPARKPDAPAPFLLSDHLRAGETILWEAGMDAVTDRREQFWALPVLVLVMAAIGGWILLWFGGWTWLWQGLISVGSLAVVAAVARSDARSPNGPQYALTNKRVILIHGMRQGQPTKIEERELRETAAMKLKEGRDGSGTVIFEKKTRFVWHGQSGTVETYEFSFKHIPDAQAVFAQIGAARAALAPQFSPDENRVKYFFKPPPGPLP